MENEATDRGSLSFTLWGIPTVIRPSSWLVLLILGSSGSTQPELLPTLLFVAAGMLCLLVHEYGHALTCRAMGGGGSSIEIASLGGVTRSAYVPRTRTGHLLMVLAGPGASLLLAAVGGVALGLSIGNLSAGVVCAFCAPLSHLLPQGFLPVWDDSFIIIREALMSESLNLTVFMCYHTLFFVCVWWSLLNLLPIPPLDGGQALRLATGNTLLACRVGLTVAVLLAVVCLTKVWIFNGLICIFLAYRNWQFLKMLRQ